MTIEKQSKQTGLGQLVKLQEGEVRKIWPREEADLSQWIKINIDLLNEVLGLQIDIGEEESPVGVFRLDLAGNDARTQMPVVIENQFGKTDHDHLGKLITYAADREAGVLIWIAMEFQEPHRDALRWLNSITGQDMLFYGLKLEVFQIDASRPAPRYTVIAEPLLSKLPRPESQELPQRQLAYQDFWAKFLQHLKSKYPGMTRASTPGPQSWFSTGIGNSGFSIGANFTGDGRFRVELYIDTGNKEQNKAAFAQLRESEGSIHEAIGEPLEWQELPERRASRISLPRPGTIDDTKQHEEYISWSAERMTKFREVFRPFISRLTLG